MRAIFFTLLIVSIQNLTASPASASVGFSDKYYFDHVATFMASVQGSQSLHGHVFDVDRNGRALIGHDCADLKIEFSSSAEVLKFKVSSVKTGVQLQEYFDINGEPYGDVHLRRLNKNRLDISVNHPVPRWVDSERTTLEIEKDDLGRLTLIRFKKSHVLGSYFWTSETLWQKGFICRAKVL